MSDNPLDETKKALAQSQRERERKTEPRASALSNVVKLINEGRLDKAYLSLTLEPTNRSEHFKLPPEFKKANQDLLDLNKIAGLDKSRQKALENQADEWYYHAKKSGVTDISKPVYFEGKKYEYPGQSLEAEKKLIAGIEANGERILQSLNQLARSEPQILDNANKRLKTIRQVLKVPQSYEEIQQGLPPIEKPVLYFISDLRHAEQDKRSIARKVLADAGIKDGDAINSESDNFDARTGRPFIDQTDRMMLDAKQAQDKANTTSPTSQK